MLPSAVFVITRCFLNGLRATFLCSELWISEYRPGAIHKPITMCRCPEDVSECDCGSHFGRSAFADTEDSIGSQEAWPAFQAGFPDVRPVHNGVTASPTSRKCGPSLSLLGRGRHQGNHLGLRVLAISRHWPPLDGHHRYRKPMWRSEPAPPTSEIGRITLPPWADVRSVANRLTARILC